MNTHSLDDSLFQDIKHSFRGASRATTIVVWLETLAFFAVAVWAAVKFFDAETTRDHILYATVFLSAWVSMLACKIWYHNRLNRAAMLRAISRRTDCHADP